MAMFVQSKQIWPTGKKQWQSLIIFNKEKKNKKKTQDCINHQQNGVTKINEHSNNILLYFIIYDCK